MKTAEHWEPEVVDGLVVIADEPLTDAERIDRLERIINDLSIDLTAHGGGYVRRRGAIQHLLKSRGWFRDAS